MTAHGISPDGRQPGSPASRATAATLLIYVQDNGEPGRRRPE